MALGRDGRVRPPAVRGREDNKKIDIDLVELEKLASIQATQLEIACWFGVSIECIEKRLASDPKMREIYERGRAKGRISVRRAQMKMLEEGNATMGIWLGKQLLGQRDVTAVEHSGPMGSPITVASLNLNALSVAELQQLYELRRKIEPPAIEAAAEEA